MNNSKDMFGQTFYSIALDRDHRAFMSDRFFVSQDDMHYVWTELTVHYFRMFLLVIDMFFSHRHLHLFHCVIVCFSSVVCAIEQGYLSKSIDSKTVRRQIFF